MVQKMRKMKDCGIEWIGEIPEGWEVVKAKYLFAQRNEKGNSALVLLSPTQKYGVIPQSQLEGVVQVKENTDLRAFKTIHIGDFVISLRSFQGGFEFSNYEGVCSPAYQVFHATKDLSNDFFRYLFKSDGFISKINSLTVGIREGKNIQYWDFSNMLLALPPKEVQIRSAQYLNAKCTEIDTMLSKTRASIEEYKKFKQAVITQAVTEGTPAMFSSPHSVKLKYLISIVSGEAIRNEQLSDFGEYPVYGGGEIIGFCSQYNTSEGSLIIGRVGARCGCVTHTTCKSWATDNALIVLPTCNAKYMYYVIGHCQLNNLNTSNAQPLITSTKIKNVVVPYFSDAMQQQEIADYLDAKCAETDGLIAKKEQLVKELESYKKSLIYEVVTGKREV